MASWRPSSTRRGMTTGSGGWVMLASLVAAVAAGVVLSAVSSGAASVTPPRPARAKLAQDLKLSTAIERLRRCRRTKEYLLDDLSAALSTSWDPQQFEPAAATPCTVYDEAAVVHALARTLAFANGNASCCASSYFSSVLRPLSWMQVAGRPRGNLCIPDTYWENLGWHVANFATGMHTDSLGEEGTYGLPKCHFPRGLLRSLMVEAGNWACVYARQAATLSMEDATRFVLPAYSNTVRPMVIPGSEVAADLRQCLGRPMGGASSKAALPNGTDRLSWMEQRGAAEEEGGGADKERRNSFRTTVQLNTPSTSNSAGTRKSRWDAGPQQGSGTNAKAKTNRQRRQLAPSNRRCGRCPVRYTPINDRWCCARYCAWYGDSMALAVTSRQPSQFGCCVKMNKRCITSK